MSSPHGTSVLRDVPLPGPPQPLRDPEPELFEENRERLVNRFRHDGKLLPEKSIILLQGAPESVRFDTDHEDIFRQESFFAWTFGVNEPDWYGAVRPDTGESILFMPRLPEVYAVWCGPLKTPEEYRAQYGVSEVRYTDEMQAFLQELGPPEIYLLQGKNTDSGSVAKAAEWDGKDEFELDVERLFPHIVECRVHKGPREIDLLRHNILVNSEAHLAMMRMCKPGMREYQLEAVQRFWSEFYGAARIESYTWIVGSGPNAAILHYGHSGAPNNRVIQDGDIVLGDLGNELHFYASDITTSFPANGTFSEKHKIIYEAVLDALYSVEERLRPGVQWGDMHLLAMHRILTHLRDAGLVRGDVDAMLDAGVGAIFMPHGLGHFLGIDTHDVGGYPEGAPEKLTSSPNFKSLRTRRTLEPTMVITVEPGCYMIDALLDKALADPALAQYLVPERIAEFRNLGGVRLEDNVVILEDGMENFVWVPRKVEDVEGWCQGRLTDRFSFEKRF